MKIIFSIFTCVIRQATTEDASAILEIYNHYIMHSTATFENQPLTAETMQTRVKTIRKKYPWLVYVSNQQKVLGYAYASPWNKRSSYRYTAEVTTYVKTGEKKKGIGFELYHNLIAQLKEMNIHLLIASIAVPNEASIALHKKFNFNKAGHFEEVGLKFDRWIDVEYYTLNLKKS